MEFVLLVSITEERMRSPDKKCAWMRFASYEFLKVRTSDVATATSRRMEERRIVTPRFSHACKVIGSVLEACDQFVTQPLVVLDLRKASPCPNVVSSNLPQLLVKSIQATVANVDQHNIPLKMAHIVLTA